MSRVFCGVYLILIARSACAQEPTVILNQGAVVGVSFLVSSCLSVCHAKTQLEAIKFSKLSYGFLTVAIDNFIDSEKVQFLKAFI